MALRGGWDRLVKNVRAADRDSSLHMLGSEAKPYGSICWRCRTGLGFPGIDQPHLPPEVVLANSPQAREKKLRGINTAGHESHSWRCNYSLEDDLPEFPHLTESASRGCGFCRALLQGLRSLQLEREGQFDRIRFGLDFLWDAHPVKSQTGEMVTRWILQADIEMHEPNPVKPDFLPDDYRLSEWLSDSLFLFWPLSCQPDEPHARRLRMPPPMAESLLNEQSIEFILSNTNRCVEGCRHSAADTEHFAPRRLIDVRRTPPRLVDTHVDLDSKQTHDLRYATLSYCWGTREDGLSQLRLLRESVADLQAGFTLEAMSPVQSDAVTVTRALGIPYLWIDAICILQDDAQDWERESSLMHKIYGNSHITICNIKTASCRASFLETYYTPERVPFDPSDEREPPSCYEMGPSIPSDRTLGHLTGGESLTSLEFYNARWLHRAWTFQEGAMSTRMVLFAKSGVYFSCSNGTIKEYDRVLEKPQTFNIASVSRDQPAEQLYRSWNTQIVKQFSGRRITYMSDSLPALSGIAQRFAALLQDEYVAGIWQKDLLHGLFWRLMDPLQDSLDLLVKSFAGPYNGPSWSWIGRVLGITKVGEVRDFAAGLALLYPRGVRTRIRKLCGRLEARTTSAGLDKFGKLSGAELLVEAPVYPLALGCCFLPDDQRSDCRLTDRGSFCVQQPDGSKLVFSFFFDFFPNRDDKDPKQHWKYRLTLVLIGSIEYMEEGVTDKDLEAGREYIKVDGPDPYGLILCPTGEPNTYWRVGTFGPSPVMCLDDTVFPLDVEFFEQCEKKSIKIL